MSIFGCLCKKPSSAWHIARHLCEEPGIELLTLLLSAQKAKEQGDFLLVGLHTDEDVSERRGPHLPIMDLHERCLSVLACKYVDEVIIGTCPCYDLQCVLLGLHPPLHKVICVREDHLVLK